MPPSESRDFSRSGGQGGEQDEDEEEIEATGFVTVKDAVLFAIDVSESMLRLTPKAEGKKGEQDCATVAALKCAYQLMQQRIISNPSDMMGVLLFGTEKSKMDEDGEGRGNAAYPHCYLLTDLDVPGAEDVKSLRDLVQNEEESSEILEPSEEPVSMANVLFCANQVFTTKAPNFSSRRLFLVTDNDSPHAQDKALKEAAAVRAKDLFDLGVIIELFPIAQHGKDFDKAKFYDNIVYKGLPSDPDAPAPVVSAAKTLDSGDGISLLQSLISSVNSKAIARRSYFNLPLEIAPELRVGVKGYIMIKRQEPVKSGWVWVGGEKAQIATVSSTQIAEDTTRKVDSKELQKAYEFGGEHLRFSDEEHKAIRLFGDAVIRIIGFKPLELLPPWANSSKTATFLYPDETNFVGSTRVFAALQQELLESKKFALVCLQRRQNASPELAAMIPGAERLDDSGDQVIPPGLWIIKLPFADDIRRKPETAQVRAPDGLVDVMKNIILQLRLPKGMYDPTRYPNPSLQWFYRILQALALEEDIPNDPEDKTLPRYKQIHKRAGELIMDWAEELNNSYKDWRQGNPSSTFLGQGLAKRPKTEDGLSRPASKKQKISDAIGDQEMKQHYDRDTLKKLKVADLADWLKTKNVHAESRKKDDLIAAVENYFSK